MEETNLPKIEVKADVTKTIENAYDDTFKKPLKSSSNILTTVLDFFHNTILYPMQKYNLYAESKLESYSYELQERAKAIPEENLISPRVNILGPTFDGLKYNLDEDHIKEMFTNILISDMDNRKQDKVLPSYIEIVKQLSKDDALFLKHLKVINLSIMPIIRLKLVNNDTSGYNYVSGYIICRHDGTFIRVSPIVLDNLLRLKIFEIPYDAYIQNIPHYEATFNKIKMLPEFSQYKSINNRKLDYEKSKLDFTEFGKNFIDICLS